MKYLLAMYHAEMQHCAASNSLFDIDVFELILSITVAIGSARPENLVKYLSSKIFTKTISRPCSISMPLENVRKRKVFWHFQGVEKSTINVMQFELQCSLEF